MALVAGLFDRRPPSSALGTILSRNTPSDFAVRYGSLISSTRRLSPPFLPRSMFHYFNTSTIGETDNRMKSLPFDRRAKGQ